MLLFFISYQFVFSSSKSRSSSKSAPLSSLSSKCSGSPISCSCSVPFIEPYLSTCSSTFDLASASINVSSMNIFKHEKQFRNYGLIFGNNNCMFCIVSIFHITYHSLRDEVSGCSHEGGCLEGFFLSLHHYQTQRLIGQKVRRFLALLRPQQSLTSFCRSA